MRFIDWKHLTLACALLALGACKDPSGASDRKLARVVVVSGDLQAATGGTELPDALVVRAEDAGGRPVARQLLAFAVTAGAGQLFTAAMETDAEGIARNRWTLGTVTGDTQRVEVRAIDPATGAPRAFAQLRALARADAPTSVQVFRGNNQREVVGTTLTDSLAVLVRDQYGNPVPGVGVTWSSPNGGSILPNPALTDAQGVARVGWTLPTVPGPLSAVATMGGASVTFAATAVAGPTVSVTVTPTAIEGMVNGKVLVEAFPRDAFGNPTEGPIDFIIGDPELAYVSTTYTGLKFDLGLRAAGETTLTARIRRTATEVVVPLRAVGISFARVSAGQEKSCGLVTSGGAYCWGGTPTQVSFPRLILGVDVDAMHCARSWLRISGWYTVGCSAFPETKTGENYEGIAVGGENVCMWQWGGAAYCWGLNNAFGELGIGTRIPTRTATRISGHAFNLISAGPNHVCALHVGGTTYCWGRNEKGQLGTGSATGPQSCDGTGCSTVPVAVAGGITFRGLTIGFAHSCGLDAGGAAWCWGANDFGQLGDGTTVQRNAPVRAAPALAFHWLTAGYHHTCGITTSGETWCWGSNSSGQLGGGTIGGSSPVLVRVTGGVTFTQIDGGREHTCAVATDERVWCWGDNDFGQLGIGVAPDSGTPQRVRG